MVTLPAGTSWRCLPATSLRPLNCDQSFSALPCTPNAPSCSFHGPDPVAAEGCVVLAVKACALNYHDLFTLRGMPGIKVPMPIIMGIDVAGEIAAVGPGVSDWKVGSASVVR